MPEVNFTYEGPLSLIRYVQHLLAKEQIKIAALKIHPMTVHDMVGTQEAIQYIQFKGYTNDGTDRVMGIPFEQGTDL